MTRHPAWCVPHECAVLDDPDLPAAEGWHRSQTVAVASEGLTCGTPLGPVTAWLTQLPTPDLAERPVGGYEIFLHLACGLIGELLVMPAVTADRALRQLVELVARAVPGTADAPLDVPQVKQRPRVHVTWVEHDEAAAAEARHRMLGGA